MPQHRTPSDLPSESEWTKAGARNPDDLDDRPERYESAATSACPEPFGDDPMTDDQAHKLKGLCWRLGVPFDKELTKVEAARRIEELENRA